ncbi:sugar phosphorylase [Spirulina sp. CS-785/01]|uniref:sugar phosphorylase n=1 Tax=Spirulina sp. CS-785/01 TaxID=3021716 RepID=UPI00232DB11C|nr:sugar phosphorylase [Spirulina sp. CS-785/01]MDB9312802.1 sugar phosphorylase [Spirulina sp. CS-785/01]
MSNYQEIFAMRVRSLVETLYPDRNSDQIIEQLFTRIAPHCAASIEENLEKWSQHTVILITYGDSIYDPTQQQTPLTTLHHFLRTYLRRTISGVHILPFCPYSSDDGFAVIDYLQVNPNLGTWEDIKAIAQDFDLMADLVLNHVSSESIWFEQFKNNQSPGKDYFITVDPDTDISQVVRPRSGPLLIPVTTTEGEKYVWATFSEDQIDLNFANPQVLLAIVEVLLFYMQTGAKYIRLDAVAYLWKQLGTPCIHLPETHAAIRLLREILQMVDPQAAIITETNVPNRENLSYFGNCNEAHLIYNFSLPPLLIHALLEGRSDYLRTWMMSMPPAPRGCAYFNFIASHDGIGLRPAEGLLSVEEFYRLVNTLKDFGGEISYRRNPNGSESPYEVNISLFDAMKGTVRGLDQWQIERFICANTLMMSLEGIPGFYIHTFLGTKNDRRGLEATGRKRSINRYCWDIENLEQQLNDPDSSHRIVFHRLSQLLKIRCRQPAFHPNATQYTLHPFNRVLFMFWRQSMMRDQGLFCIFNLSDRAQTFPLSNLNLTLTDQWSDLISGQIITDIYEPFTLQPYQSAWITNKVF